MSELRDMNGKPVVRLITEIGESPEKDASGWIFYLWPDKTQLIPQWKKRLCAQGSHARWPDLCNRQWSI
jgi:hypothetical protein